MALIERGNCQFSEKATAASNAGAIGVVIFNNAGNDLMWMTGDPVDIPTVFIGQDDGWAVAGWCSDNLDDATAAVHPAPI